MTEKIICGECVHKEVCNIRSTHKLFGMVITSCNKFLPVEVEPVKHGKWSLLKKTATWKTIFPYQCEISCSVCGYGTIACDEQSKNDWLVDMNFCPNCGAKMDGGNEND